MMYTCKNSSFLRSNDRNDFRSNWHSALRARALVTKRSHALQNDSLLARNERKNSRQAPPWVFLRLILKSTRNRRRFAITGQQNRGKVCRKTRETCPAFVRSRKRIFEANEPLSITFVRFKTKDNVFIQPENLLIFIRETKISLVRIRNLFKYSRSVSKRFWLSARKHYDDLWDHASNYCSMLVSRETFVGRRYFVCEYVDRPMQVFDGNNFEMFSHLQDERGRLMRRNIVRYAVLAYVITLQRISLRVKRRFPTLQHIVDVGQWVVFILSQTIYFLVRLTKRMVSVLSLSHSRFVVPFFELSTEPNCVRVKSHRGL